MKKPDENKLDKLFKDGITGSETSVPFREEDWAAMEKLLDKKSGKRGAAYRLMYYASGIAAVLLLIFGLYFFAGKPDKNNNRRNKLTNNQQDKPEKHNDQSGQVFKNPVSRLPDSPELRGNYVVHSRKSKSFFPLSAARKGRYLNVSQPLLPQHTDWAISDSIPVSPESAIAQTQATASQPIDVLADTSTAVIASVKPAEDKTEDKKAVRPLLKNRPRLTLSILAAPDLNSAGTFAGGHVGGNIGIQLGLQLTSRFAISTGIGYAAKPYQAGGFEYGNAFKPPVPPTNIAANCKVLDIPVNVSYRVFAKGKNAVSIGTGLSSYLMLREHYRFDYDDTPNLAPFRLDIANQNKHWFGVLNLNATYQRQINSRFSAVAQPYLKLPLTGIGNGNVNLRSAGVALGVSWNINAFGKPK